MAKLRAKPIKAERAPPPDDPVFFHKGQISTGVVLRCYGRRDPNSQWRVVKIHSYEFIGKGEYREVVVSTVQHLSDVLEMQKVGSKEKRALRFGAASYSAIWRLD